MRERLALHSYAISRPLRISLRHHDGVNIIYDSYVGMIKVWQWGNNFDRIQEVKSLHLSGLEGSYKPK